MINGEWVEELIGTIGQYVYFETRDGVSREGRLSSVKTKDFVWNGKKTCMPFEIEINGDIYDTIPLERLVKLGVVKL